MRMIRPMRCWYTRREAVGARCMHTVARGEFQPSASSIALIRTLISPRSYAASVSARRTGGVRPDTAELLREVVRVVDARGVHDPRRVVEALAVEARGRLVQRLVVERLGQDL